MTRYIVYTTFCMAWLFMEPLLCAQEDGRSYLLAAISNARAMERFDVVCTSEAVHEFADRQFTNVVKRWRHIADFRTDKHVTAFKQEIREVLDSREVRPNYILRSMMYGKDFRADYDLSKGLRINEGASVEFMLMLSEVLDVRLSGLTDRVYNYQDDTQAFEQWVTTLLARPIVNIEGQVGKDVFVVVLNDFEKPWYRFRIDTENLTIKRVSTVHADGTVFRSVGLDWEEKNGVYVPVECRMRWQSAKQVGEKWRRVDSSQVVTYKWLKCNESVDFANFNAEAMQDPKALEAFLAPDLP